MPLLGNPTTTTGPDDAARAHTLPPPGTDPRGVAMYANRLAQESARDRRRQHADAASVEGLNYYVGNQWEGTPAVEGAVRLVVNRILKCVIAQYAVQAGDPPKIKFAARESNEPPVVYVNTATAAGQELLRDIGPDEAGNPFDPLTPLPDELAQQVRDAIAEGEAEAQMAAAAGLPPPSGWPTKDAIVEVTARTAVEALQTVFDGMWDECDAQAMYVENVCNKNILGWQPTRYEFDDNLKRHILENVHPRHVFLDPSRSLYDKCQYQLYLEPISLDEAIAKYHNRPKVVDEAKRLASQQQIKWPSISGFKAGYPFTHQFERGMIAILHCWVRNQPYPMSEEDAVRSGRVVRGEMPTGEMTVGTDPDTGMTLPPEPVMRSALFHKETGEELAPTLPDGTANANWPVVYRERQITCIGNATVDDRPSQYGNLPIPWNRNVPIPFCPYGQGEPECLKGMQDALNRALSSVVTHTSYTAFPPEVVRGAVADAMGKQLRTARTKPGQRLIIPEQVMQQLGDDVRKAISWLETADMPADFWKLIEFLVRMIDVEGNMSDVMQGNAAAGWSGDTVVALQTAATQVMRGKSIWTEFYLRDLARLMVHSIITRMGPRDWARYCKKLPVQALEAMHDLALSLDVNISVQIASGSGATKQQQTNNLLNASLSGKAPVSPQTILESLDRDPDVELRQTLEWQRKVAAAQGTTAVPVQSGGQPPPAAAATNNDSTAA